MSFWKNLVHVPPQKNVRITITAMIGALIMAICLWRYYEVFPRTPDGRVRADILQITPDVSGLVTAVHVKENQTVKTGDPLFEIDKRRYQLEKERAEAMFKIKESALMQAERESQRNGKLKDLVSHETVEQGQTKVHELTAEKDQAKVALGIADLNLERSTVRATINGKISNFSLQPGHYAIAGQPLFAIVDTDSLHVDGYFEETKLRRIHLNDEANIELMGQSQIIKGHVVGIAGGIEDRDRSTSKSLLADVNPTFSWVRLAQRIPVRIALDEVPPDLDLVVGRTAAIEINDNHKFTDNKTH